MCECACRLYRRPGLLNGSEQQISDQRGKNLNAHRIFRGSDESPDFQILFDPLEEQLYFPALFVEDPCERVEFMLDKPGFGIPEAAAPGPVVFIGVGNLYVPGAREPARRPV